MKPASRNNGLSTTMTAIVTGGSGGIGLEFARQLAARGYDLVLVSNQGPELEVAKRELEASREGIVISTLCIDLASDGAAGEVKKFVHSLGGAPVEVLVNNAGIFDFKMMTDMSSRRVSLYIDLHIRAVTELSLLYASEMASREQGYILNMSSMSCWMPMPGIGMYAATKAYLRVFSRSLHLEMREKGVKVMVACPGGIATDLFGLPPHLQRLGVKVGALATPRRFVKGALKRLFKGRQQYVNGLINRLAIVAVGSLPRRARLVVKHKMLDK